MIQMQNQFVKPQLPAMNCHLGTGSLNDVHLASSKIDRRFNCRNKNDDMPTDDQPFLGCRFLIIEDEPLVAMHIAALIEDMGGTIAAVAHRLNTAVDAVRETGVDCATVDVNLAGELSFPVALLLQKAQIPFAFCTAYADSVAFPAGLTAPRITKPFEKNTLRRVLVELLHSHETR